MTGGKKDRMLYRLGGVIALAIGVGAMGTIVIRVLLP
jgi:hypothetical protein